MGDEIYKRSMEEMTTMWLKKVKQIKHEKEIIYFA